MQDPTITGASYKDVPAYEFNKLMGSLPDAVLLDVRTAQEVRQQSLDSDLYIDFMQPDFAKRIAELDKSKTYLVYCRSGNRSGQACQLMSRLGFTDVYNLSGGLINWPY